MREIRMKTIDGREVVELLPETEADVEELRRMAADGGVDDREQFNDPAPPRPKRARSG